MNTYVGKLSILAGLYLAVIFTADAGEVRTWTPTELSQRADVIVVGQAIKIEATSEKGEIRFNGGKAVAQCYFKARVRIAQVIKGDDLGEELVFFYSNQIDKTQAVSRIWLKESELFLLYLQRTDDGGYVGALEGEFHDSQAAKLIETRRIGMGAAFGPMVSNASSDTAKERSDWARYFEDSEALGTIVISDERKGSKADWVYRNDRAEKRFSPASTFKIPHALFALDAGVVSDEFETIAWDGIERSYPAWNQNQNLRSSMRYSVVWVYQKFAQEIGERQEREYLKKIQYGNEDPTGADPYWVKGNLRVSAYEQIEFLKKLYRNQLPFSVANQRLVKDIMIVEAGRDWILRAKTGWAGKIGWWVGWVEHPTGTVFFALNIDTPNRSDDLPKREGITRGILSSLGALEPKQAE